MTDISYLKTLSHGNVIRSLLDFLCYAESPYFTENPYPNFAIEVRKAFKNYVKNRETYRTILYLRSLIPNGFQPDNMAYWKKDRKRFLGCVLMKAILPWYQSKEHKHSDLLIIALDAIIDRKDINEKDIDTIGIMYLSDENTSKHIETLQIIGKFNDVLFQIMPYKNMRDMMIDMNESDVKEESVNK